MVAHDTRAGRDPSRQLSADVVAALREALLARLSGESRERATGGGALAAALRDAARDARARMLLPEELIIALKAIEADVAAAAGVEQSASRATLRSWMVTLCIEEYFGGAEQ